MIVHQVLSGAGPVDAVTRQALAWRDRFARRGWGGRDVAVHIDPRIGDRVAPLDTLAAAPGDVLLVHFSAYAPRLSGVLDLPNPTLLLSHNVTPASWFWDYEPMVAIQCALGRRQLPRFAERADLVAGVSAFNAAELGSDVVIPILFGGASPGASSPPAAPSPPTLLFVGRLAPHKRQDELIRVLALLRRHRIPDARLVLVGEPLNAAYVRALTDLAETLAPGAVTIESSLSDGELAARYAAASVFVSLSEHEGFCIPLLEAFAAGVPVIARPSGGVPEVAGDAALLPDDRDAAVLAELIALTFEDDALRSRLTTAGHERVKAYAADRTEQAMVAALQTVAAKTRR